MQGESNTLTVLLQLLGLDSHLGHMLIPFQQPDSLMEVLVPAQEGKLIVFYHTACENGEKNSQHIG